MARTTPYGGTELSKFITHRVAELKPRKSQAEIASEAGFINRRAPPRLCSIRPIIVG